MDSSPASHMRRRTNSFACTQTIPPLQSHPPPIPHVDSSENVIHKPTRFRRSSFVLSGEKHTVMDDLVDSASQQLANAAAQREATTITTLDPIPTVAEPPQGSLSDSNSQPSESKRVSVATLVPHFTFPSSTSSDIASESDSDRRNLIPKTDPEEPFVWYNSAAFSSNPLTSDLVLKYLAAIALDKKPSCRELSREPSPSPSVVVSGNIPGFLSLNKSPIASMALSVHHFRKEQKSDRTTALTDHANVLSDTDSWLGGWHSRGYISDTSVPSEAKQLRTVTGLESELRMPSQSVPRSTRRQRSDISKEHPYVFKPSSPSRIPSKFDVSRVYEGLPMPSFKTAELSRSTTSLNSASPHPDMTPPSTPNSVSSESHLPGMRRLRSFFGHFKPTMDGEDGERYIYMDEETRERRAKALASNVISPVSF